MTEKEAFPKRYEILLLDVDGTLLDFDRAEAESFKKVLEAYGFSPEDRYVEEYHRINKECWEALEEGRMERARVLTARFERFFGNHGVTVRGEEAEAVYRRFLDEGAYLLPHALEVLDYLKDRYELYIVTNGTARTQHLRLAASGLQPYFKDIFISEETGSQKPQKEFFDRCFARIPGADPARMLIIGDSLSSDIQGGVNAGIDTCWLNPHGEENCRSLPLTWEITQLEELKTIL